MPGWTRCTPARWPPGSRPPRRTPGRCCGSSPGPDTARGSRPPRWSPRRPTSGPSCSRTCASLGRPRPGPRGGHDGRADRIRLTFDAVTMESPWLFPPGSVTWRLGRESCLLLGGGRALLLQVAHPGVAAGVAEHSDFRSRPLDRLLRTLGLTLSLSFGNRPQVLRAARTINRTHDRVRGDGYHATDPRLLLWVHATLIDGVFVTYEAFVRPLEREEREAYYAEAQVV